MKNRIGFVAKGLPQPQFYRKCFDAWCAVYWDEREKCEYHLQLVLDAWGWQSGNVEAVGVEVLKQLPECRVDVHGKPFKTIKSAVLWLVSRIGK